MELFIYKLGNMKKELNTNQLYTTVFGIWKKNQNVVCQLTVSTSFDFVRSFRKWALKKH